MTIATRILPEFSSVDAADWERLDHRGNPFVSHAFLSALDVMGPRFAQIYGQGESPMCITALSRETIADRTHPRWRERLASVGLVQSCMRMKVADASGAELPPGEIGEILAQGPAVMAGYWRNPQASAETLKLAELRI